ncbi:hypothetical protein BCR35DRAFT_298052 [Leucosporidium creatinivorum]|uniref:Uncharacterized protein n=1 Tax=Leucosporidium creatinivorum TaxID=106004 RepID=A0A1Y2G4Z4_9BASI|nr:hypothetical protein BCR35DRAFT_298052 [Leucosporidium creatinivorum]
MDNPPEARSSPSPPAQLDDKASRPLPSLPTEILQRIIQLTLPRLSFNTFRERYDTLLNLCRVNKLWAAPAQEELYRHVGLTGKQMGKRLIESQRSSALSPLPIKSLRALVGEDPPEAYTTFSQLERLVPASPKLAVLQIVAELDSENAPAVDLGSLSALAEGLEELAIDYCRFSPSPSQSPLLGKNLRRLTLSILDAGGYASLLASADLPQLDTLIIQTLGTLDPEGDKALEKALFRYAPRLRSFTLYFTGRRWSLERSRPLWSSFSILHTLTLDSHSPVDIILPLLSAPLARLRLRPPYSASDRFSLRALKDALLASPSRLPSLRHIMVPAFDARAEDNSEARASKRPLAELCSSRGIVLVERERVASGSFIASLEDAVDDW